MNSSCGFSEADLLALGQEFWKGRDPLSSGLTSRELGRALKGLEPTLCEWIGAALDEENRDVVTTETSRTDLRGDQITSARDNLVAAMAWEIIYRKHPGIYDAFACAQSFPLDKLYPPELADGKVVLDIGCGTGRLVGHLLPAARKIFGVDPAPELLRIARSRFRSASTADFRVGQFNRLPLATSSVHLIVSHMAFSAASERDGISALKEMRRVAAPGAEIRFVVGSSRTMAFLRRHAFSEGFIPGAINWDLSRAPIENPIFLFMLARAYQGQESLRGLLWWHKTEDYLFRPDHIRLRWSLLTVAEFLGGTPHNLLFFGGDPRLPIGTPYYRFSRAR